MLISKKARTGPPIGRQISTEHCQSETVGLSILSILLTGSDQQDAASVPSIPANVFREIDSNVGINAPQQRLICMVSRGSALSVERASTPALGLERRVIPAALSGDRSGWTADIRRDLAPFESRKAR